MVLWDKEWEFCSPLSLLIINLASKEIDVRNSSDCLLMQVFMNPLWVGGQTSVSSVGLVPSDAFRKLTVPSGFHHHHAPSTSAHAQNVSFEPHRLLSAWGRKTLACVVASRWRAAVFTHLQKAESECPWAGSMSWGSREPVVTVHCRFWFPGVSSPPSSFPACWFLDLHYGLVEFLNDTTVKAGC